MTTETVESAAAKRLAEFEGIFEGHTGTRPVMSKPPQFQATKKFIHEIQNELNIDGEYEATTAADWIANKMERYAALTARPVFDMDGNGPQCSLCMAIWPLCGHHHMTAEVGTDEEEEETEKELSGE